MKSAYELAMERFGGDDAAPKLTDDQKAQIAEVDQKFTAKIAEREVFLGGLISKARQSGNHHELPQLEEQKRRDISLLRSQCESAKEEIRQS